MVWWRSWRYHLSEFKSMSEYIPSTADGLFTVSSGAGCLRSLNTSPSLTSGMFVSSKIIR